MSDSAGQPSRYITPEALMKLRFGDGPRPRWDIGILCFRGPGGGEALVKRLGARPVLEKSFYGIEPSPDHSHVHEVTLGGRRIVVVSHLLWGAPQAAILTEELAALGAQVIVGYGVAGSLVADLPKGTQIFAATGVVTDGTSPSYTTEGEVAADAGLVTALTTAAAALGIDVSPVVVATVDALFRETPDDVRRWLARGARAINMETAPLYAAATACAVKSLWLGHISDTLALDSHQWDSWLRPAEMTDVTVALVAALLEELSARAGS
jgi:uridine phosphorylase